MFRRDRPAFFFTFAFPIMFIVLFGLIFGAGGTSRPTVDVVGNGPLRVALERSDALDLKPQPDEKHALKRVSDGDEPAAVLIHGGQARLVYARSSTVEAPIVIGIVRGIVDQFNLRAVHAKPAGRARLRAGRGSVARLRRPARARDPGHGDRPERGLRRGLLARRLAPEGHAAPAAPDAAAAARVRDGAGHLPPPDRARAGGDPADGRPHRCSASTWSATCWRSCR